MRNHTRAVIESANFSTLLARIKHFGVRVADEEDEHGKPTQEEAFIGRGNGLIHFDVVRNVYLVTCLLHNDDAAKLPDNDNPNFKVIWHSDDLINVGTEEEPDMQMKPRPTYMTDEGERLTGWI